MKHCQDKASFASLPLKTRTQSGLSIKQASVFSWGNQTGRVTLPRDNWSCKGSKVFGELGDTTNKSITISTGEFSEADMESPSPLSQGGDNSVHFYSLILQQINFEKAGWERGCMRHMSRTDQFGH